MSWGYWGIVAGLLVLVTLFFVCLDLLYREQNDGRALKTSDSAPSGEANVSTSGSRHAA